MELKDFMNTALEKFTQHITDQFFLFIENDKELFQNYQRTIGRSSNLDDANLSLGYEIKSWFNLGNKKDSKGNDIINKSPKSKLIKSYTEHCKD